MKDKAEQVQANLKAVGVKVNIKHLDAQSYYDTLWTKKDYDLIFYRTYSDALMPYNFMNSVFKNNGDKPGVLANDKVLTQQLEAFPKEIDKQSQKRLLIISLSTLINNIMVCLSRIQTKHS